MPGGGQMKVEHNCLTHPTIQALSFCHSCGRYFCSDCLVESGEFYYCTDGICQDEPRREKVTAPREPDEQTAKVSLFKRVTKLRTWIWPHITDTGSAKKASKQGYWACALIVGMSLLFIVLSVFGKGLLDVDLSALLDVLIFLIIGWGIYKMNRFAAVAGFFLSFRTYPYLGRIWTRRPWDTDDNYLSDVRKRSTWNL